MALNIKNAEVERLATELAHRTHQTKTQTIRRALEDLKQKVETSVPQRRKKPDLRAYLEQHVWPSIPPEVRGKRITKEEVEEILGIGPDGY